MKRESNNTNDKQEDEEGQGLDGKEPITEEKDTSIGGVNGGDDNDVAVAVVSWKERYRRERHTQWATLSKTFVEAHPKDRSTASSIDNIIRFFEDEGIAGHNDWTGTIKTSPHLLTCFHYPIALLIFSSSLLTNKQHQ